MFRLKVIQALYGDCLILEYGTQAEPKHILIDGGPKGVYQEYLKTELLGIRDRGGKINLLVLSHIDEDHVKGLDDLLSELVNQRRKGQPETISINGLWHNAFGQSLGAEAERGLSRAVGPGVVSRGKKGFGRQARSIKQGNDLAVWARGLRIPINAEFRDSPDRLICADNQVKPLEVENLKIWVVGPTRTSLQMLQKDWEKWLDQKEKTAALPAKEAKAAARDLDKTVPNLSSIMLLVEALVEEQGQAKTKSILLTGDGLCEHLIQGLEQTGFITPGGTYHVDVFKLPHHGSMRNVTPELFDRVLADTYIISADGTYDNPDYQTLEWLVQAAKKQNRPINIVATNETESIRDLVGKYKPEDSCYTMKLIEKPAHSFTLDLNL